MLTIKSRKSWLTPKFFSLHFSNAILRSSFLLHLLSFILLTSYFILHPLHLLLSSIQMGWQTGERVPPPNRKWSVIP